MRLRLTLGARCAHTGLYPAPGARLSWRRSWHGHVAYSFATPRGFDVFRTFTLANYAAIFDPSNTVWMSFAWSLALAACHRRAFSR